MLTSARDSCTVTRGVPVQRYYTEQEIAVYGGLSVRTLQNWRLRNIGPPFRKMPTGGVRYALDEFDTWMQGQPSGGGR